MVSEAVEGRGYREMFKRIKEFSDDGLKAIVEASVKLNGIQDDYQIMVGEDWVSIPFDDWLEAVYSEMWTRGLQDELRMVRGW